MVILVVELWLQKGSFKISTWQKYSLTYSIHLYYVIPLKLITDSKRILQKQNPDVYGEAIQNVHHFKNTSL